MRMVRSVRRAEAVLSATLTLDGIRTCENRPTRSNPLRACDATGPGMTPLVRSVIRCELDIKKEPHKATRKKSEKSVK